MIDGDNYRQLNNVRFKIPTDTISNWMTNNPVILPGELVGIDGKRNIKIGTGERYSNTDLLYIGSEPNDLSIATPIGNKYYSVTPVPGTARYEDYLKVDGKILFPITLDSSVRRNDGTSLRTWVDNISEVINLRENKFSMGDYWTIIAKRDYNDNMGIYVHNDSIAFFRNGNKVVQISTDGCVTAKGGFIGGVDTAKTLKFSRAIALSGVVTGTIPFNGSADVSIATTFSPTALTSLGAAPKNLIIKNISVPVASWNATTKQFEYANSAILDTMSPSVRFAKASIDIASKASIICWTDPGKLVLEAKTIPTGALTIEVVIFTPC